MPAALKIRVIGARNLPVMDTASGLTDAYVDLRFAQTSHRSAICYRSLNPVWNQDFRIEVADDCDLQDHPLVLKCWDKDLMSTDDEIGAVCIDLNPLCHDGPTTQISGWFPLYDTLRGVRGELSIVVKMDFVGDVNPFKESGTGVQFFSLDAPPAGTVLLSVVGLVEELVIEPDPEYHWVDSFRTSRLSNERRQLLLYELSGKLRRLMGARCLEAGGNAVLGYKPSVDLEGEHSGVIVARGLGTSVKLASAAAVLAATGASPPLCASGGGGREGADTSPDAAPSTPLACGSGSIGSAAQPMSYAMAGGPSSPNTIGRSGSSPAGLRTPNLPPTVPGGASGAMSSAAARLRNDVDEPAAELLAESAQPQIDAPPLRRHRTRQAHERLAEVALLTMENFAQTEPSADGVFTPMSSSSLLMRCAGVVSARSVKLVNRVTDRRDAQLLRDSWWSELREEMRAHARSLSCSAVIGYGEQTSYHDDLCILSAYGTAVLLKLPDALGPGAGAGSQKPPPPCAIGHTPYLRADAPFPMRIEPCAMCGRKYVPELLLATIDRPAHVPQVGESTIVQARVCRTKKRLQGESSATAVSQALPFVEYDLHRQLMYKLKVVGKNAVFGLRLTVDVGETLIVAVAEATAVCLPFLPAQRPLHIQRNLEVVDEEDAQLVELQRAIEATSLHNHAQHAQQQQQQLSAVDGGADSSSSDDEAAAEPSVDGKQAFVVEVDDEMDEDMMAVLLDPPPPAGIAVFASEGELREVLGDSPPQQQHTLSLLRRVRVDASAIQPNRLNQQFSRVFHEMHAAIAFKVRRIHDAAIIFRLCTRVSQPTDHELELMLTAHAMPRASRDGDDRGGAAAGAHGAAEGDRSGVLLSPLSFVPGEHLVSHLGPLALHFIKESWTLREEGGIGSFCHAFVAEAQALARAHIAARGGNAALKTRFSQFKLTHSAHKNHAYALLSMQGDIVLRAPAMPITSHAHG